MQVKTRSIHSLRLRTVLLFVNFLILVVPLSSLYIFHVYEDELIQQTERELLAQASYIQALYKFAFAPNLTKSERGKHPDPDMQLAIDNNFSVIEPILKLSKSPILPSRPDAVPTTLHPDDRAKEAAQKIFPIILEATRKTLAGVRITDSQGIVVAGRGEVGQSLAEIPEVRNALLGHYTAVLRERISKHDSPALNSISRGSHLRVFIGYPVIENGHVVGSILLSRAPRNVLKGLYDNSSVVLMAAAFIIAVTVFIGFLTSYAIGRPIHTLTLQAERIALGSMNVDPIAYPVTKEIELLSATLTAMAKTLATRSDYIRNFAMHVSHEFKTPLTAIQGAIELIGEHGQTMTQVEQQRFIQNIMSDTDRLKRLMQKLMELARADVLQVQSEDCDVIAILRRMQCAFTAKGLNINLTLPLRSIRLAIAEDIVETVLINLLENSLQHEAVSAHIEMISSINSEVVSLSFHDDGTGISVANADNLFTPFFTTKRDAGGTGLGLTITRSLLTAYKARIEHKPTESGTCFVVTIPRSNNE